MGDEAIQSEPTAAAVVEATETATAEPVAANTDDTYAQWKAGEGADAQPVATEPVKTGTTATKPVEPPAATQPTATLTEAQQQIVKRFKLNPTETKAFRYMDESEQREFISSLDARQRRLDQAIAESRKPEPAQPPAQAANLEDAWKPLVDAYGDDIAKPIRDAVEATLKAQLGQQSAPPALDGFASALEATHAYLAMQNLDLPRGMKMTPEIKTQLLVEAHRLIGAEQIRLGDQYDFNEFNLLHSLPLAANQLFAKEYQATENARKKEAVHRAISGSASPSGMNASKPAVTDIDGSWQAWNDAGRPDVG